MPGEEYWWKRRPYLGAFLLSLVAATIGLAVDLFVYDRALSAVLPGRLFHFVVLFTILATIEWVNRRFSSSRE